MAEFLYNAWSGWTGYTNSGKLPALLMGVLLFLWFGRKRREQGPLLVYTSVMTICCVLPVTAAVLVLYQTKFYNYEWIWSLVPVTAVIAYGLTVFWTEYRAGNAGAWRKVLTVTLALTVLLLLCGSLGGRAWDREARKEERLRAYSVVEQLSAAHSGERICLWAPREIMEYAREKDAGILLPYGRNIWDGFLDAYSYDLYNEDIVMMERWMEELSMTGETDAEASPPEETGHVITLEACVQAALEQGVNCIMITGESSDELVERMEKVLGVSAEALEGYYLFAVRQEGAP